LIRAGLRSDSFSRGAFGLAASAVLAALSAAAAPTDEERRARLARGLDVARGSVDRRTDGRRGHGSGAPVVQELAILRKADAIYLDEIRKAGLYDTIWQAFAVLLPVRTVGVMGDFRTYAQVVALRAVVSQDAMTADWARLPYEVLARISSRIINEVKGVNRVVYDISSKPPSTIEWE